MRKGLVGIFLLVQIIGLSNLGYCKWRLINKTPPIEGRVTDATTGQPIENVVISCEWVKEVPAFVDTVRKGFAHEVAITDKQGRYRIPSKRSIHFPPILCVGSSFDGISINIAHPLYSTPQFVGAGNECVFIPFENRRIYKSKDGIIHYDISLLSLEEKYVKAFESLELIQNAEERKEVMKKYESEFYGFLDSYGDVGYFMVIRNEGIKYDFENVSRVWDSITNKIMGMLDYPKDCDIKWKLEKTKRRIREVIK